MTRVIQKIYSNLAGFVTGSYITRDQCDDAFARMHRRDRIGDRLHLVFACIAMIGIAGPVSVVDIAVLPLVVFFLVRVFNTFPIWIHGFGQPVVLVALMLAAWMGISLLWSPDPHAGLEHMSELRWLTMIGFVYPVIEHRRVLIACLCIGFLIGSGSQVVDAFDGFGNEFLSTTLWHEPERVSGWWDPAVGGSVLVAALGLHLPAALMGKGRWRLVGYAGSLVMLIAVIATGTRGAWIAAVGLIVIALIIAGARSNIKHKGLIGIAGVVVLILSGLGVSKLGPIEARIDRASDEISRAIEGDYTSSTGARISMGAEAIKAGTAHPLKGIGAGGFEPWMIEATPVVHDDQAHAHNMMLQLFAELEIPGVMLGVLLGAVILINSWKQGIRGGYAMGPCIAFIGIMLVSAFDSVLLNVNTAALIGALAALSPAYIPKSSAPESPA